MKEGSSALREVTETYIRIIEAANVEISPLIVAEDPSLAAQIDAGFADYAGYGDDLRTEEESGTRLTPEQADLFGTEAQNRATRLVGQVSQAIALRGIQI